MASQPAFLLVPTVGNTPQDILREFDGNGAQIRVDAGVCAGHLQQGARTVDLSPSPYELPPSPESDCLAFSAAARQGARVGFGEMAEALTHPDLAQRARIEHHLAQDLAPSQPSAQPAPTGPSLG